MNSDHLQNETPADRDVKTIHSLEQQLAVEHERYLRLAADFDNYKKRMAREMDRRAASQKEALVRDLLPAVDNLERIVAAKVSSGESLYLGAKMIFDQVIELLKKHGFEMLPRSLQGKVQRARMREMVLERYVMTDGRYPKFAQRNHENV